MYYFLDSSALVKRYISEMGSVWIRQLCNQNEHIFVIAHVSLIELVSAINKRKRMGDLTEIESRRLQEIFFAHYKAQKYELMALDKDITKSAIDLLNTYPLRAYDAVQLATALNVKQISVNVGSTVEFICSDEPLCRIALKEGLTVKNPVQEE